MTTAFIEPDDIHNVYPSPEQYRDDNNLEEGDEFYLLKVEVVMRHQYRIIDGKPVQIAFAVPGEIE